MTPATLTAHTAAALHAALQVKADALRSLCPEKVFTNHHNGDQIRGRDLSVLTDDQLVLLSRINRMIARSYDLAYGSPQCAPEAPLPKRKAHALLGLILSAAEVGITL